MNTTLLLISSGLFGVLLGMCIAALLMSNHLDAGRQDTQRLDFAERQKANIGQHGDAWAVLQGSPLKVVGTTHETLRGALDAAADAVAHTAWEAPRG